MVASCGAQGAGGALAHRSRLRRRYGAADKALLDTLAEEPFDLAICLRMVDGSIVELNAHFAAPRFHLVGREI